MQCNICLILLILSQCNKKSHYVGPRLVETPGPSKSGPVSPGHVRVPGLLIEPCETYVKNAIHNRPGGRSRGQLTADEYFSLRLASWTVVRHKLLIQWSFEIDRPAVSKP